MKKKITACLVWVVAGLSFLAACAEGWFYYAAYVEFQPFQLLLIAQNAIKTFLFSPSISAERVLAALTGEVSAVERAAGYAYLAAVFLAPLCTGCALWKAFERQARRLLHFLLVKQEKTIMFGYNEQVKCLLSHETSGKKWKDWPHICLVTDEDISHQEELELLRQGITLHHANFLNMDDTARKKAFSSLGFRKFETIFLFEESSATNLSLYLMLLEHYGKEPDAFGQCVTVYSSCDAPAVRRMYGEMHDQWMKEMMDRGVLEKDARERTKDGGREPLRDLELVLFSIPQMQSCQVFEERPLHTCNVNDSNWTVAPDCPERWNVHLLIAGFGAKGQQILMQAMNLGVLHSGSRILVDIFDVEADKRREIFLRNFDADTLQWNGDGSFAVMHPDAADGSLVLRFHKTDLCGQQFATRLRSIQADMPLTYAALCVNNTDVCIQCLTALKQLKTSLKSRNLPCGDFPVVLNLEHEEPVAQFLNRDQAGYREVVSVCSRTEVLTMAHIVNTKMETQAHRYHEEYQKIQKGITGDAPVEWERLDLFQREANRCLYHHSAVKKAVLGARGLSMKDVRKRLQIREDHRYAGEGDTLLQRIENDPEAKELVMLEHRRWCYVMAMQGWSWAKTKDVDNLQTPYLIPWETLRREYPHVCLYDLIASLPETEQAGKQTGSPS